MRLIDADELLKRIDICGTNKFGMLDEDIREFVKKIPTIDAEPVRHGRWIKECNIHGEPYYICSECHEVPEHLSDYCPKCGAEIDGEER